MLRITRTNGTASITLKVEGKLTRHSVGEFAQCCLPLLRSPESLVLDCTALAYLDDAGVKVVRDLMRRRVRVNGCSPLVANLLKETQQ